MISEEKLRIPSDIVPGVQQLFLYSATALSL